MRLIYANCWTGIITTSGSRTACLDWLWFRLGCKVLSNHQSPESHTQNGCAKQQENSWTLTRWWKFFKTCRMTQWMRTTTQTRKTSRKTSPRSPLRKMWKTTLPWPKLPWKKWWKNITSRLKTPNFGFCKISVKIKCPARTIPGSGSRRRQRNGGRCTTLTTWEKVFSKFNGNHITAESRDT